MADFYFNERRNHDLTILDLDGDLTLNVSNTFLGIALQRLSHRGQNQIILNFTDVSQIDAAGFGAMIQSRQALSEAGGQLKICSLNTKALELMTITKLLTVFDVFENETQAVDSFKIRRKHPANNYYINAGSNKSSSLKIF